MRILAFGITILLASINSAWAQDEEREEDRKAMRAILADVELAINSQAFESIEHHLDPQVVITFQNAVVARGIEEIKAYRERMLNSPYAVLANYHSKAAVEAPAVFHGDTAVAYGTAVDTFNFKIINLDLHVRWSATLMKQNGIWKVIAIHFSTNLFNNTVVNVLLHSLWVVALLSLLVGYRIGRRR